MWRFVGRKNITNQLIKLLLRNKNYVIRIKTTQLFGELCVRIVDDLPLPIPSPRSESGLLEVTVWPDEATFWASWRLFFLTNLSRKMTIFTAIFYLVNFFDFLHKSAIKKTPFDIYIYILGVGLGFWSRYFSSWIGLWYGYFGSDF